MLSRRAAQSIVIVCWIAGCLFVSVGAMMIGPITGFIVIGCSLIATAFLYSVAVLMMIGISN